MKKTFIAITLLILTVGLVNAQSISDIRKNAYDAAITASSASKDRKSAREEYEEKKAQSEETIADVTEDDYNILTSVAILYPSENNTWVKAYCYALEDYIWYTIFYGNDNNWWINLAYNEGNEIGEIFYATKMKSFDKIKATDEFTGKVTAALKLNNTNDYLIIIQDKYSPTTFAISW